MLNRFVNDANTSLSPCRVICINLYARMCWTTSCVMRCRQDGGRLISDVTYEWRDGKDN